MSLHYPFGETPAPGELFQICAGVFWLRLPLPFQLDHINLWLLRDGDGWTLVDTGFPDEEGRTIWRSVLATLQGPLKRIIVTHFHPDHLGLADWLLQETGARLLMTSGEFLTAHAVWNEVGGHGARFMVEQFRQHGLDAERLEKFAQRGSGYRKAMPSLPDHYDRLKAGDSLTIDGRHWHTLIGHGHAPEHLALHCPELGLCISGDMLLPRISTNISVFAATPDADALGWYLASLTEMSVQLPAATLVLPSHGRPFTGVAARVTALQEHHRERLQALEASCASTPRAAAELLDVLFGRTLDTHQTMFAMGEAIAHLNHLHHAGRLLRHIDAAGIIRYTCSSPSSTAH